MNVLLTLGYQKNTEQCSVFHQKLCFSIYYQALFLICLFLIVKLVPLEELVFSHHPSLYLFCIPPFSFSLLLSSCLFLYIILKYFL